jgi:CDP-glycerol glycerophosphotransferase (TagB/SpsB family)
MKWRCSKMGLFRTLISEPCQLVFTLILDHIIPKSKDLYVYGSTHGRFVDNSRFLFEHGIKNERRIRHVWVTSDKNVFSGLSRRYSVKNVVYANSLKGFITVLRAKVVIVSYSLDDITYKYISGKRHCLVNLWHGSPMKNVGMLVRGIKGLRKIHFHLFNKSYSLFTTSSDKERRSIMRCWGLGKDKVVVTGYPRNDILFRKDNKIIKKLRLSNYKKIVLYAPTWREEGVARFFPFKRFDIFEFNRFLKKKNILLVLRGHLADFMSDGESHKMLSAVSKLSNIDFIGQEKLGDVNELLPYVDILITDYSGIYFDFLLTDKPCIFVPYDFKKYKKMSGMLYDYNKITAGPKVLDYDSFVKWIDRFCGSRSPYRRERAAMRVLFHKFYDAGSSRRVFMEITKKII